MLKKADIEGLKSTKGCKWSQEIVWKWPKVCSIDRPQLLSTQDLGQSLEVVLMAFKNQCSYACQWYTMADLEILLLKHKKTYAWQLPVTHHRHFIFHWISLEFFNQLYDLNNWKPINNIEIPNIEAKHL